MKEKKAMEERLRVMREGPPLPLDKIIKSNKKLKNVFENIFKKEFLENVLGLELEGDEDD